MQHILDYYKILDIHRTATPEEIENAFQQQSLQCNPDRAPAYLPSVEMAYMKRLFQQLNEAYQCLSDPNERKRYDVLCNGVTEFYSDPYTPSLAWWKAYDSLDLDHTLKMLDNSLEALRHGSLAKRLNKIEYCSLVGLGYKLLNKTDEISFFLSFIDPKWLLSRLQFVSEMQGDKDGSKLLSVAQDVIRQLRSWKQQADKGGDNGQAQYMKVLRSLTTEEQECLNVYVPQEVAGSYGSQSTSQGNNGNNFNNYKAKNQRVASNIADNLYQNLQSQFEGEENMGEEDGCVDEEGWNWADWNERKEEDKVERFFSGCLFWLLLSWVVYTMIMAYLWAFTDSGFGMGLFIWIILTLIMGFLAKDMGNNG